MKWPFREASIRLVVSKKRGHKGEINVCVWKSSLGFGRSVGGEHFFKTKAEALEYISTIAIEQAFNWIDGK